jgi:hypothetical protein
MMTSAPAATARRAARSNSSITRWWAAGSKKALRYACLHFRMFSMMSGVSMA